MSQVRIGHDIQRIADVERAAHLWCPDVVFTADEIRYARAAQQPAATLSGLFCAREALHKALGRHVDCFWTDAEVARGPSNRPRFNFGGRLAQHVRQLELDADLSISHSGEYASAVVVLAPLRSIEPAMTNPAKAETMEAISDACATDEASFEAVVLPLLVRPNDLDRLGHVNNAVVLEYFETGRRQWLRQNRLEVGSVIPVVARVTVNYRKEIPETSLTVETVLQSAGSYAATFAQRVLLGGQVAADAEIQVGFVDQATRRVVSVEDFFDASRGTSVALHEAGRAET